jgi:hypothetical protein
MLATPVAVAAAVATYGRRTAVAGFVAGAAAGAFVTGVIAATTFLGMHLYGAPPRPHAAWALAALPALAWGAWRAVAERVPAAVAAGELDRRLGADGLLLTAHELGDLGADWRARLQPHLAELPCALPPLPWQRWWPGPILAVLLAGLLGCLGPTTVATGARTDGAFAARHGDAAKLLAAARLAGTMAPELADELAGQLSRLAPLAGDAADAWRELDGVLGRIAREQLLARLDGERGLNGAAAIAAAIGQVQAQGRALLDDPTMSAAAKQAIGSLLGGLGSDVARQLADPQRAGGLAARWGELAADLAQRAEALGLGPRELGELRAVAGSLRDQAASLVVGERSAHGQEGVPGRGPGHVARRAGEPAPGSAERALPLPNGGAGAEPWVPAGDRLGAPEVAPVAGTASGVAPAAGRGGASWQLQLAPHHRAVVQKFFAGAPAAGEGKR